MAKRRTSNFKPASARKDDRKRRLRLPRVRREFAILGALAAAVILALGALGVAAFQTKMDRDWTTVATVNGHGISRESLRGRVAVVAFLAKERDFFLGRSTSALEPGQLQALRNQAVAPTADVANTAREQLIDEEMVRQLAAREGVATPPAPDSWAEARDFIASDLAHQIRFVRFELPEAGSTSNTGSNSTPSASPSPSPSRTPSATPSVPPSNPWPAASASTIQATEDRLKAEFAAGTKIETIVAGLHDAGWKVYGEDVAVSTAGIPADASLQLDPEIASATLTAARGTILGPATDEYGRVSMAKVLAPADRTILANLLQPDAAEMKLDTAALADWANAQALRRALSDTVLRRWQTRGVTLAHFREIVVGNVPSSGAAGPWVELSGLSLNALSGVSPSSVASAPPGLDLSGDKLAATLRSMSATERTALFARLQTAANAATPGSSVEVGFASKDGLIPDVSKAAFDKAVKTGDVLGPITTSAGPQLFLVEAHYNGPLDERAQAALRIVRADPAPDPVTYTTRFSAADLVLARDGQRRADAEFATDEDVHRALFDTPLGALSDPFTLDGKLAFAIVSERRSGIPDQRTAARLTLDGYDAWLHSERVAATITRIDHPLPELEPSRSPSPSPTLALPTIPGLETPALPTIPGGAVPTPLKTDELGLPALP
jgi:hypothetical protein